jgi:ribosome-binding protein aMBF1 (putative translation factor)
MLYNTNNVSTFARMNKTTKYLSSHQSSSQSKRSEEAQWRRDNSRWLGYSRFITMKIMQAMDEQKVTQSMLASRIGCSQQYVSNLLKGSSNMTLETISKIEDALEIDIVKSALTMVSGYSSVYTAKVQYLSDGDSTPYGNRPDEK